MEVPTEHEWSRWPLARPAASWSSVEILGEAKVVIGNPHRAARLQSAVRATSRLVETAAGRAHHAQRSNHDPQRPPLLRTVASVNGAMKARAPEIGKAFGQMFQALMKDGALSVKQKELIALGIGVAVRCEPCIHLHVEKSLHAGATSAEIMEAAGVAVMMGGGPVSTYAPVVAAALDHFEKQPQAWTGVSPSYRGVSP